MVAGTAGGSSRYGRLRRVVTRPLPWVLRYLISTIPAFVLAPLIMLSLRSLFRYPIVAHALKAGSADLLLELLDHAQTGNAPSSMLGLTLLLVPLAWLIVRAIWLWTEGGILTTYAQDGRISARRFARLCTSWFGPFLLLDLLGGVMIGILIGLTAGITLIFRGIGRPFVIAVVAIGALFVIGCWVWFELARVTAVVRDDRHVLRALGNGIRVAGHQLGSLMVLVLGVLAVRAVLSVGANALLSVLSFSWWLPAFVIQQVVQILAVGLALTRRAGQVELALRALPPVMSDDEAGVPQPSGMVEADG